MKHNDKRKLGIIATLSTFAVFGLTATLVLTGGNINPFNVAGEDNSDYFVTLDSSNKYTSGTTKDVTTSSGAWQITFEYSGASSYANGHVTLSQNGSLQNKTLIKSVDYIQVDWNSTGSGKLQAKTSFNGSTWGELWDVTDDFSYHLPSNPYFISFVATGGSVNISSVRYQYSCIDNPEAEGHTTGTQYKVVKSATEIKTGDKVYIVGSNSANTVDSGKRALTSTAKSSTLPWYLNSVPTTVSGDVIESSSATEWTVTVSNGKYIFSDGSNDLYSYIDGTHYSINMGTSKGGTNLWTYEIQTASTGAAKLYCDHGSSKYVYIMHSNGSNTTFTGASSTNVSSTPMFIYKKTNTTEWNIPKDIIGFTATDSKSSSYKTTSIYSSENGLSVTAHYSDGTSANVLPSEYTYKVSTDRAGQNVIDKTKPFGTSGIYYVTVNYANLMPSIIELNVGASITGVTAAMSNSTYTTADTVVYANNLTATLQFDNGTSVPKTYAEFASAGLTVKLMTPAGVEYNPSLPFGTAGNWKVRVSYSASIYADVSVTVNAVPVQSISVSPTSYTLTVGGTVKLTATINPVTATNKNVSWSTSAASVATVNDGLVTAVSVGTANITATSEDGSFKAVCAITVNPKPIPTEPILVTDVSELQADDKVYLACASKDAVAGDISSSIMASLDATFSSDDSTITNVPSGAVEMTLGGTPGAWTFANADGDLLGATAVKKLAWGSGTTTWSISINSDGAATIQNATESSGRFLYNVNSPRFTTYTSDSSASMLLPGLYKSGSATPVYPTAISFSSSTKTIAIGEAIDFSTMLQFTPSDTNQKDVTWNSTNTSVATVSNKGLVTGIVAGSTTITATAKDVSGNDLVATCNVTVKAISVTGVSLDVTSTEMSIGGTKTLTPTISPSNATNKNVTWTSSNTSVATVSGGVVTAKAAGSATITVKTVDGNKTATCSVTVTETQLDDWTILLYMCGSDLESGGGYATKDLNEIKSVSGQPSDVNFVVETGGSNSWSNTQGGCISSSKLSRFHLSNKSYVSDSQISDASMGQSSTLKSFIKWGVETYPAEKIGLILWNHGGALDGVCFDEKHDDDCLTATELNSAVSSAYSELGRTSKFEFIGYDACLMAVQDNATLNSDYFNYMVCSQESEAGDGWDYDTWLDDVYAGNSTPTVLTQIVDGFISSVSGWSDKDQTLSWLNLGNMPAYITAWENMSNYLYNSVVTSKSAWTTLANVINACGRYGYCDTSDDGDWSLDYNDGYLYDIFDAGDFISRMKTTSPYSSNSTLQTYITACSSAYANLIGYEKHQTKAGGGTGRNTTGLCMFAPLSGYNAGDGTSSKYADVLPSTGTKLTNWRKLVQKYGSWYSSK